MISIEGKIINTNEEIRRRVEIDETSGLITKVVEPTGSADFIFNEELIFPGFIDLHVHAREDVSHAQDYKEDFVTAGEAAINGGVVAFAEMPNNPVPPVDDLSYDQKIKLSGKSPVEVVLYAGIGRETQPLSRSVPYKVFMGPSVGELFFSSKEELERRMEFYKGQNVSFHCEDPEILDKNKDKATHEERRGEEAEVSAVDFALHLIEKYDITGKICHASTKKGLEKIKEAKARGVKVVVEVSPHHLYYDAGIITDENRKWMQMNPPLRRPEDRDYLIRSLQDGTIDFLATDHAPHTKEEKLKGTSGTPQLDTYGLFVAWLMKECNFSASDIVRVCSRNPSNFFNQFSSQKYGKIEEGYAGSLTILDLNQSTTVIEGKLKTKCRWSPFSGVTFPGSVAMTIVKGKVYEKK